MKRPGPKKVIKARKLTAAQRTGKLPFLDMGSPVKPAAPALNAEPEYRCCIVGDDIDGSRAHLIPESAWKTAKTADVLVTLCGTKRYTNEGTPWVLVGISRTVCQGCVAASAKFRIVRWRGKGGNVL